jgi:hypothetical protein
VLLLLLVIEKWSKEQLANRARRYKKTPMIGRSHGIQCGGKDGEGRPGGGNVLETLLSLILSEKAGINISGDASTSRPLEDFIQKFTGNGGQSDRGQAKQETASTATAGKRDNSG